MFGRRNILTLSLSTLAYSSVLPFLLAAAVSGLFIAEAIAPANIVPQHHELFAASTLVFFGAPLCVFATLAISKRTGRTIAEHFHHCALIYSVAAICTVWLLVETRPSGQIEPFIHYVVLLLAASVFAIVSNAVTLLIHRGYRAFAA